MSSVVFIVLAVAFGALGFFAGGELVGALEYLRSRPRYLMTAGTVSLLLGLALGEKSLIYNELYFAVMFLMMGGVGLVSAGWQAEKEWQADRAEVHDLRMSQIRRQLAEKRKVLDARGSQDRPTASLDPFRPDCVDEEL